MCNINNREQLTGSFLIKLYNQYSCGRAIIAAISINFKTGYIKIMPIFV